MTEKLDNTTRMVESKTGGGVFREDASEPELDLATLTNAKLNVSGRRRPAVNLQSELTSRSQNPLTGIEHSQLMEMGAAYAKDHGLEAFVSVFEKGALIAQNPDAFESLDQLDDTDKVSPASCRTVLELTSP